ncbi:DNA mismatch endonuclease Vsr [Ramlibacter solisilvae]|uniref:very short patch repair endonuclease n=1 Tax=Ramlibacter tataouinensis TaxID=94132 RepID=UPI0009EEBFE1|nr:DNA mismatch endonuclease Vsr [Ramlibacter tataouinensis]
MTDRLSRLERSRNMSRIRSRDTEPELRVRRYLHAAGLRYKLHVRELPGCPDLVFPSRGLVLFVHGCFWHRHEGCRLAYVPKSNFVFWEAKFAANIGRDERVVARLASMGWRCDIVWECQTRDPEMLAKLLAMIRKLPQSRRHPPYLGELT